MNAYITGATIKRLREAKSLTQSQLAERLGGGYLYLYCNKHGLMKHRLTR